MIRLAGLALDRWADLDGYAIGHNLPDLRRMPLGRFCNFVWWWLTRNASDEAEVEKFRAALWRPPPGEKVARGPWSPEAETQAFAAFKSALGR